MRTIACALMLVIVAGVHAVHRDVPASTAPDASLPARALGYYDESLRRVVLVGGPMELEAGARDHVWSWSGARWELVTDSGPPTRGAAAVAYDATAKRAVLAGGAARIESSFATVDESWAATPDGWRRMTGSDIAARDHHSMVFDASRGTLLLFGGIPGDHSTPWPSDTWALGAHGWTRIAAVGPAGRGRSALAYDAKRRQVVLFGGVGTPAADQSQPWFGDTWIFEQDTWRRAAEGGPRARYAHAMVFDERAGVVLMYGGAAAHRGAPLADMWSWDGSRWTEIPLSGATPGHRYSPVMVYDRARERTVLYGGDASKTDTWEWDGAAWRQRP